MKNLLKKLGIYYEKGIILYDGEGYTEGMGVKFIVDYLYIFHHKFIIDIKFQVNGMWTEEISKKLTTNWLQERGHIRYILELIEEDRKHLEDSRRLLGEHTDMLRSKVDDPELKI